MTQKVLENAVRELQKLISVLADKVESLEGKVIEQSALIAGQTDLIKTLKTQVEGKEILTSQTSTATILQTQPIPKLVRPARLAASAKMTQSATGKMMTTRSDKVRISTGGTAPHKSNEERGHATTSLPIATENASPVSRVTMTSENDKFNNDNNDEGKWQQVSRKGRRPTKPRQILTGSGKTVDELQTAERLKFIQAWSFRPETTTEQVRNHINKIASCEKYVVEKRTIKTDQHAAFVIGFPETYYNVLCNANAWPLGIKISDWFRIAPRTSERGSLAPEAGRIASVSSERASR